MAGDLKNCPFCGSDWQWNWSELAGQQVYARCNGDDCGCAVYAPTQRQVIDRINRRATGPATAAMVEIVGHWMRGGCSDRTFEQALVNGPGESFLAEQGAAESS